MSSSRWAREGTVAGDRQTVAGHVLILFCINQKIAAGFTGKLGIYVYMSFLCRFNTDLGSHLPEGFIIVSERFFFFLVNQAWRSPIRIFCPWRCQDSKAPVTWH